MTKRKLITGILLGAAAVSAIYTLCYTKEGKKFSRKMKNRAGEWGEAVRDNYKKMKGKAEEMADNAERTAKKHDPKFSM